MAVWNIQQIELPHYQNALSFDFIAIANNNPGQYIYQYRMDGVDDQWIENTICSLYVITYSRAGMFSKYSLPAYLIKTPGQ